MHRYLIGIFLCAVTSSLLAQPLLETLVPTGSITNEESRVGSSSLQTLDASGTSPELRSKDGVTVIFSNPLATSFKGKGLGLQQAVRLAVERHPSIADAVAMLDRADSGISVARSGYYPQVRAGLGSGNSNNAASSSSATRLSASVSQMLYDFGKVDSSVRQANTRVRRQQGEVLKQVDAIAQQAAGAILMAHRFQMLEGIAKQQVTAVMSVYELARLRGASGLSTQADPIQAWSRVDAARANYLQIRSQQRQWHEKLRTLLGLDAPQEIESLPEELLNFFTLNPDFDPNLLPEILIAKAELEGASADVEQAKAQRMPTLSVDASVDKLLNRVNQVGVGSDGRSYSVMFNVSSAVFQGGSLQAQVRGALAAEEAARKRIETALLNVDDRMRSYREQLQGAKERLTVLSSRKRTISEVRNLYREQYTLGTRSILDLLNAEQEIYQSAQDEETVRHDLWDAWIGLVNASGLSREVYDIHAPVMSKLEVDL